MTLTDFLLARIAEDEARWQMLGTTDALKATAAFLLAECEAKWQIVEDCRDCTWGCGDEPNCHDCIILGHLALPYADHDDYREEWRP